MNQNLLLLSMQRVLAGLVHNINTPLNLILGYSQQLQLSVGDNPYLQKILDAGFKIDDILRIAVDNIHERTFGETKELDLGKWLHAELTFLQNELSIKRKISFSFTPPQETILVTTSAPLLGLIVDSLVLNYRDHLGEHSGAMTLTIDSDGQVPFIMICFSVPEILQDQDIPLCIVPSEADLIAALPGVKPGKLCDINPCYRTSQAEFRTELRIYPADE